MKITWIIFCEIWRDGVLYSDSASIRYRVIIPAAQLINKGHINNFLRITPESKIDDILPLMDVDVIVVSKLMSPDIDDFRRHAAASLEAIKAIKEMGKVVVADFCDNHFEHPVFAEYYLNLAALADTISVNTRQMADIVMQHAGKKSLVIGDPAEGVRGSTKFLGRKKALVKDFIRRVFGGSSGSHLAGNRLRLLWFGHPVNINTLPELIPQLEAFSKESPLELNIVTSPNYGAEETCNQINATHQPGFTARFVPWSLDATWQALRDCDLVVIPSRPDNPKKQVKSPNRLVESLWAGRFVVANPLPAYQEFAEFAWLGDNINDGIEWALQYPREVSKKIAGAQEYIEEHYSPHAIAAQWETALSGDAGAPTKRARAQSPTAPEGAVKLNLGCGDKILPGYVNVDVAPSRRGLKPDVLCDLHDLYLFDDDSADEILAVHVVEHFWRWEALDILREWVRVLKSGGQMILECPNLISACEQFLKNPEQVSGPGPEGQRTMWVFYGDPAWQDPLMVHRWGYTPHSLAQVMREAGLINVRQEPAQFKLREPRDMRLVGEKAAGAKSD